MKRFLKITGYTLAVIFVLLLTLPFLFKGKIVEAVKKAANDNLHAVVQFEGVSLSLIRNFPNLRVSIEQFTVDNVAPFDSVRLAQIGSLEAVVDIKSVFGDQIKVKRIALIDPVFDVRVKEDGTANYDIAKADTAAVETPAAPEVPSEPFSLKMDDITIENLVLVYNDQSMPMKMEFRDMDLKASGDVNGDITTWSSHTTAASGLFWFDGVTYLNKARLDLKADLEMDMANMKFTFKENELQLNELILKADGWLAMPEENIDMDITFAAVKNDFRQFLSMVPLEFASDLSGVDASGNFAMDGYVRGTYNETSMPGLGLNLLVENGRFKYPDLPKSVDNIQIKSAIVADMNVMDNTTVDVDMFHLEMAGNPVDMQLKLRTPESDPDIDFMLKAFVDLDKVKEFIPLEENDEVHGQISADLAIAGRMSSVEKERYEEFKANGTLGIRNVLFRSDSLPYDVQVNTAEFAFSPAYVSLDQFNAQIGRSDISASGRITDYLQYALKDSLLIGRFDVKSKLMDLNEFMTEDSTATASSDAPAAEEAPMTAIELPGNIDFALTAELDKMIYGTTDISNVKGGIGLKDKIAALNNLTMNVLDGSVGMSGHYNAQNLAVPKMDMVFDIKDMDINKAATQFATIDKLAPVAKACNGRFTTKFSMRCDLTPEMMPVNSTVNGSGSLTTKSVTVKDFAPLVRLADKINYDKLKQPLTINDINVSFKMVDGVVNVDPFIVKLDGVPAKIYGSTTLDQVIDYNVEMDVPFEKFPSDAVSQATSFIGELNKKLGTNMSVGSKVNVIARITGTVTDPKVGVTSKALGADAVKDLKEQAIEAVKEVVKEKATELKNEALEKAIAEKERLVREAQAAADKMKAEGRSAAQKVKDGGYKLAKQTEDSAKNPLERQAKKLAADKMRKEADEAYNKAVAETDKRANKLVKDAEAQGDKLIQDASSKGDQQINKLN